MIRICYSRELQPGLHGRVERRGRDTFVYLLSGLTPEQRGAALRRMRQQGRMNIGPKLPVVPLAIALLADRVRTVFGQASAVVRVHPAGSALPVMTVCAAVASFLVLSALSVHIVHLPPQAGGNAVIGNGAPGGGSAEPDPSPSASQQATSANGGGQTPALGVSAPGAVPTPLISPVSGSGSGGAPGGGSGSSGAPGASSSPGNPGDPGGSSDPSSPAAGNPSSGGDPLPSTTGGTSPPPDPAPSGTPTSAPPPAPSTSPSPTPTSSSHSAGQLCVAVGALGICLKV